MLAIKSFWGIHDNSISTDPKTHLLFCDVFFHRFALRVRQEINVWWWTGSISEQFNSIVIRSVRSRAQAMPLLNISQNSVYQALILTDTSISRLSTDDKMVLTWCEMRVLWQVQAVISCPDQEILGLWVCHHGNSSTIGWWKFPWRGGRPLHYELSFYLCRGSLFGEWWLPRWSVPPRAWRQNTDAVLKGCMKQYETWAVLESIQHPATPISTNAENEK